ncbi:MAG TPA: hypothetical protein VI094_21740, partial [Propionibacteriaceae bacterium]
MLQLAHPNPAYGKVSLIEPVPLGYLHIGAEVRPPARPGPVVPSRERSQLVGGLKVLGRQVERVDGVLKSPCTRRSRSLPRVATFASAPAYSSRPASMWRSW